MKKIVLPLISLLIINSVMAHVPLGGEAGSELSSALEIDNPLKSWVVYDELSYEGETKYYRVLMDEGDKLRVGIITPEKALFNATVMHDDGHELAHYEGELEELKEFEPFTPSSYYNLFTNDLIIDEAGAYYIEVIGEQGKYGLVIGYVESFSLLEWVSVTIDVVNIHVWEGQNLLLILLPFAIILLGGVLINCYHFKLKIKDWVKALAFIGSLTYFGSTGIAVTQMINALIGASINASIIVTIILASIPSLLGYGVLRVVIKEKINQKERIKLAVYGALGLFAWAGLIIGPVMIMLSSAMPSSKKRMIRKKKS